MFHYLIFFQTVSLSKLLSICNVISSCNTCLIFARGICVCKCSLFNALFCDSLSNPARLVLLNAYLTSVSWLWEWKLSVVLDVYVFRVYGNTHCKGEDRGEELPFRLIFFYLLLSRDGRCRFASSLSPRLTFESFRE